VGDARAPPRAEDRRLRCHRTAVLPLVPLLLMSPTWEPAGKNYWAQQGLSCASASCWPHRLPPASSQPKLRRRALRRFSVSRKQSRPLFQVAARRSKRRSSKRVLDQLSRPAELLRPAPEHRNADRGTISRQATLSPSASRRPGCVPGRRQSKSICVEAAFARRPRQFGCREIKARRRPSGPCSGAGFP
jgi:hypothetical protein